MNISKFVFTCSVVFGIALSTHAKDDHHHAAPAGVSADKAMGWLKNGNVRFVKGHQRKDGRGSSDRKKLSTGQHPHTIVLSCSDSRVPPEHVFDQALGEIFVIRVAGQALDSSVIASIEYAVEHLGTKNIVVMGHTSCGAVKASLNAKDGESSGSPDLDKLVADIKPRLPRSNRQPTSDLGPESLANAKGVASDLVKRSKIISAKVKEGSVKVSSALYHLDSGAVDFVE